MDKYTLISGGAKGADTIFEQYAQKYNHNKIILIANNFAQNNQVDDYLKYLNKNYLCRNYPTQNEYVNNLLRRDVQVGLLADVLYAITWLEGKNESKDIHGGTAWACYTFIDKCIRNNISQLPCFIFDQNESKWYQVIYDNIKNIIHFKIIDYIPYLKNYNNVKYAGIGTRELNETGKKEIEKLYG